MERTPIDGVVTGPPKTVLRLEGAAMLAASVLFYVEHVLVAGRLPAPSASVTIQIVRPWSA